MGFGTIAAVYMLIRIRQLDKTQPDPKTTVTEGVLTSAIAASVAHYAVRKRRTAPHADQSN